MSAMGFARLTMKSVKLNYFVGHMHPLTIEQHLDTGYSNSVIGRTAIGFVAARLSMVRRGGLG